MNTIAVVMPAWNEAEALPVFIRELDNALTKWKRIFLVIDDCSTDGTADALRKLMSTGIDLRIITNEKNLGHGPSTAKALSAGLACGVDFVIALDGDGQCYGQDIRQMIEILQRSGVDVVEGARISRSEPVYRKIVSFAVRILVYVKSGKLPKDANTPFRAYRAETLRQILKVIPMGVKIPNLVISALSRSWRLQVTQFAIESIPRRGSDSNGTTWGKNLKIIPNLRFISFCIDAALQWLAYSVPTKPKELL
jgi:dolichol-phosphate mannosyltransferase